MLELSGPKIFTAREKDINIKPEVQKYLYNSKYELEILT